MPIDVELRVVDPDTDVDHVVVQFTGGSASSDAPRFGAEVPVAPSEGTRRDGVWRARLVAPQGLPPGPYYLHVAVSSGTRLVGFATPGAPDGWQGEPLPAETLVTVVEHQAP